MYDIPHRPRRNRQSAAVRDLVRETHLTPGHLIMPLFVMDGHGIKEEIASMPGVFRMTEDHVLEEVAACIAVGVRSFVLFPAVEEALKTPNGAYGVDPANFYFRIAKAMKVAFPESMLMSDVALDPYSSDGHDGLVVDGKILNDETLPLLEAQAVAQAAAGFDFIGPSDMMDRRVGAIREALDDAGHTGTGILAYSAKYASAFYGPFRDALESAPKSGDKQTYQMDPANRVEALREAELDAAEGADMIMVKPALCYLDVIYELSVNLDLPIAAYNVSGEYAMLKAAAANGWIDYDRAMPEMLTSMHRAGASIILTYFAREYAERYQAGTL
ncbi:MAG: porphobilinogen synthase [Flavobacteriales bacterium]|nr:porphobilinogen synthase [Flavobacteriales bacterium]